MSRSGLTFVSIIIGLILAVPGKAALDDYYYTNIEIKAELDSLASLYPDWIRVDSIGHSYELQEPIWSARISDNVNVEEDEPALWVNGACHSEEILGINVTMGFIRKLVALGSAGHPNWGPIIQSMEIHCVPSNNPDGMAIVMSEQDRTYRKNLHSFAADGHCQIQPGIGNDSCGVDLNRNYPAWFEHGDGLWAVNSDPEQFDYYRGPYPLSEPECACIADQTERERFVAAVAYHSARTSTNHEIIIHPWEWSEGRTCPPADYDMMQTLTRSMGDQIAGFNFEFYRNIAGSGRKGNHHNWIYSHYGAVGLLIEVGTQGAEGMQPENAAFIETVVNENIDGLNWLCRRIIGYDVGSAPGLVIHVQESVTQQPLAARLRIEEVMHPDCTPWYRTDPLHGSYYRLLKANPYTVTLRKHGYAPRDEQVNVGAGLPTQRTWTLDPLPLHALELTFAAMEDAQDPLTVDRLELHDMTTDTLLAWESPDGFQQEMPAGVYELRAWSQGRITAHRTIALDADLEMSILMATTSGENPPVFTRLFDQLEDFEQLGDECGWVPAFNDSMGTHFEDSPGRFSLPGVNCRLACSESFILEAPVRDVTPGSLDFTAFSRTEGGRDSVFVEFSSNNGDSWETIDAWSGQRHAIEEKSYPVSADYAGGEFRFAFRVRTDQEIQDEGLHVGSIRLSWNGDALSSQDEPDLRPGEFALSAAPNPFNPMTTVTLLLPRDRTGIRAEASLHNLLGQRVLAVPAEGNPVTGRLHFRVDGSALATGSYFLQVRVSRNGRALWQNAQHLQLIK